MPVTNGGNLESLRITQGVVLVEGLGLDTRTANYILSRAVEVNAGLWAKHPNVLQEPTKSRPWPRADGPRDQSSGLSEAFLKTDFAAGPQH